MSINESELKTQIEGMTEKVPWAKFCFTLNLEREVQRGVNFA